MSYQVYTGYNQSTGRGWKVKKEREVAIQCSLIKSPIGFIEPIPRCKIDLLMSKYPHQEWLGYLVGRISEKENYFIEDLSIPPHKEVSGVSAEVEPFHIPDRCIGVIHSHNTMPAFHSATDQEYVDKNFPISITVSKRNAELEFDMISYQTTECGKTTTVKGVIKYVQPEPPFDTEAFMKEATGNIDKGKRTTAVQITYPGQTKRVSLPYYRGVSWEQGYAVDDKGKILTQKQLDKHYKEIWGD